MNSKVSKLPEWVSEERSGLPTGATLFANLLRGVRRFLVIGILAGMGTMSVSAMMPWWIGQTIDHLTSGGAGASELLVRCVVLMVMIAVGAVLGMLQERSDTRIRVEASLRAMILINHQAVRLAGRTRGHSAGDVINLGVGDTLPIGLGIASLTRGIGGLTAVLGVGMILLTVSWQLCVLVIVGAVVLLRLNDWLLRPYRVAHLAVRERMGELTSIALDSASGIRTIKGLGADHLFAGRYRDKSQQVRTAATSMARAEGLVAGSRALATGVLSTATIWLAATLAISGTISIGALIAAYGYAAFLGTPIRWMLTSHQQWAAGKVSAQRISPYLSVRSDRDLQSAPGGLDPTSGLIAPPGRHTVVASVDPIDWTEIAERIRDTHLDPSQMLVVTADDYLFSGPLAEVLDPDRCAESAVIDKALYSSAFQNVVDALPDGLAHVATAGGADFSGGEQQRMRLSRALLATPSTLVLVDPTNALDANTEAEVASRLKQHRAGATTVIFTNSTPHLAQADHVIVFQEGSMIAEGSHPVLMQRSDYRALIERSGEMA